MFSDQNRLFDLSYIVSREVTLNQTLALESDYPSVLASMLV